MKYFVLIGFILFWQNSGVAQVVDFDVHPIEINAELSIDKMDLSYYETSGDFSPIEWFFSSDGFLFVPSRKPELGYNLYGSGLRYKSFLPTPLAQYGSPKIGIRSMYYQSDDRIVYFDPSRNITCEIDKDADEKVVISIGKLLLIQKSIMESIEYSGIVIEGAGKEVVIPSDKIGDYISLNIQELEFDSNVVRYLSGRIRANIQIYDDDGNGYSGLSAFYDGIRVARIRIDKSLALNKTWFDHEGNLWQLDVSDSKSHFPKLLYSGREWGYRASPITGIVTADSLRIRLRSSADSLILETLKKGQSIIILKEGEHETINGITAPWYRIKTPDGLVGWVFGGFIDIME